LFLFIEPTYGSQFHKTETDISIENVCNCLLLDIL